MNDRVFGESGSFIGPKDGDPIDAIAIFGTPCISKIVYQDIKGKIVQSVAKQISASNEDRKEYGGDNLRKQIETCGYKLWTSR